MNVPVETVSALWVKAIVKMTLGLIFAVGGMGLMIFVTNLMGGLLSAFSVGFYLFSLGFDDIPTECLSTLKRVEGLAKTAEETNNLPVLAFITDATARRGGPVFSGKEMGLMSASVGKSRASAIRDRLMQKASL